MFCIIVFMIVGGGSFMAGYLTRYFLSDDYSVGWCEGYEYARNIRKTVVKSEEDK